MATNNIQGSAKQGLGSALIIDGRQFEAAWIPESVEFERETIDVTHAQTENFKASKVAELSEPLEITGEFYFDPSLQGLIDLMKSEGANQEREIYLVFPKVSDPQGTTTENGYIYLPSGTIGIGSIDLDLEEAMKAEFVIAGGTVNPEIEAQKVVAGNVPTAISVTTSNLSGTVEGDIVATLGYPTGLTHGAPIYFNLGGADASEFTLEGRFIKAAAGVTTGVKALTVDVAGYRAWAEADTSDQLLAEAVGFTLT